MRLTAGQWNSRILEGEESPADLRVGTVLFMEIVGFVQLSTELTARQLVAGLTELYAHVERIVTEFPGAPICSLCRVSNTSAPP